MDNNKFWIDGIAATEQRDVTGEILNITGADIEDLEIGKGRFNDNHSSTFFGSLGRITKAKKVMSEDDCVDPRQKYFWEKVKSPYIYVKGYLYNDEDHINSKAAISIMRNLFKENSPLQLGASVEGGTIRRGLLDPKVLERTKIHSVALTFVPCNNQSLIEPLSLGKALTPEEEKADMELIKSVMHLAQTNVPSFRHIERVAEANKISNNLNVITDLAKQLGMDLDIRRTPEELLEKTALLRMYNNISRINEMMKALSAGFGGAGAPTNLVGGGTMQRESLIKPKKYLKKDEATFKDIMCKKCGKEQLYFPRQVRCRECNAAFDFDQLAKILLD